MEKTTRDMYISKAYVFKKSIGFFVVLVVLLLYFGQGISYGMGSRGGSGKKTTIIRGIVYDKSKPAWQGSIAGAKIRLLDVNGGFFKEVSSNARGYYEINLKLYSGRYKLVCAADNFKPAEIIRDITKGRAYDTGFDFYLEPIDTTPRNPAPEKPVTPPEPEPEPPIVEPKPDPAPVAPVIPPEPEKPACQTIGPEGGQVVSDDGKVKVTVIISLGALSEPKTISVLKVNTDNLQTAAPGGSLLLSVVECKPYGLVFNRLKDESGKDKPAVELIYDLCYEMVAGTKVELGLYDSIQDKIIPTGQTYTIPIEDTKRIKFTLQHFSTYACLDYVSKQGAPIGAGVQIPLPDLITGSFSHAIPIIVPPGRKGMQPQVGLSYRSSNSNSWVGLGFSLNSGYITRSTRLGPPSYNDKQDTFYFVTEAGTTEMVNLIDNLYQSKVESGFTKFFKEADDTWKVVTKDGSILRFGQSIDSKEGSASGTFSWYLTKAIDTNGNYIEYHYTKDQGKSYLSRIDYTGNEVGISPTNSVEFNLEPREDISSSYISTARIATAKRLKEIQAKVKGELVWRYDLEYDYSPDSNRSLLKSVKQSGADGKSLPEQRLDYQKSK